MDVFAAHGFRGSALAEVADKVGVSPANLLYHFGSKEKLLLAVIAERDRRAGEVLATELAPAGGLDALRGVVRFAEQSEGEPGLAALHTVLQVESTDPEAPAHDYFVHRSRTLRAIVRETLLAAQRTSEVRADVDCAAVGDEVVAFLEGAAVVWLVNRDVSLVTLYQTYLDRLLEDLAP
jgi:AcrR family transcriptional regulator